MPFTKHNPELDALTARCQIELDQFFHEYMGKAKRIATPAQDAIPVVTSDPGWDARDSRSMTDEPEEEEPWTR